MSESASALCSIADAGEFGSHGFILTVKRCPLGTLESPLIVCGCRTHPVDLSLIHISKLEKAKPVLKKLPGWKCDIRGIKKYEDLPENCRKYVEFVEEQIGYPITMVSNGPGREDIIYRSK